MRVLCLGELMLDLELAHGSSTHEATIRAYAGGTAANTAAWAAASGAKVVCVGRVGDDFAGAAITDAVRRAGASTRFAVDPVLPTGSVAFLDGEPAVDRGANVALAEADLGDLAADALVVSGYTALTATCVARAALERSSAAVRVLTGGSASLLRRGRAGFADAAGAATLVVVNEEEADALGGVDALPAVCVTRGARGATLRLDGVEADSAGGSPSGSPSGSGRCAGDALAATLAVELARGASPAAALASACAAGARAAASPTGWP